MPLHEGISDVQGTLKEVLASFTALRKMASEDETVPEWLLAFEDVQTALNTVDGQITALEDELKRSQDEELRDIGSLGLRNVVGNMGATLRQFLANMGDDFDTAAAALKPIATQISSDISSTTEITGKVGLDNNPFGITVTIKSTLGGALDTLVSKL